MSASGVKQGGVYIEIGADPRKFFGAVNRVNARLAQMGRSLSNVGASIGGFGLGLAAPFGAAVVAGAKFQDVLLNIRASTGQTAAQLDSVRASAMSLSQAMGVGPTEAAQGMLELLKAGMSLQDVLNGAGKSAIEFARVGQIDVATAAVVMSDAMNVFKVSASEAANTISAAADASSTSIEGMTQAFSMSSAVAALANQKIGDLSAALAVLANAGVKGSDAGTSIKTMLLRLMAPTDDAIGGMKELGLSVASFRDASGNILPMVEIIRVLNGQLKNLDRTAQDDVLRKIFGSDAIRAAAILTSSGVEGFEKMQGEMRKALPVGEKFKQLMSGMAGAGIALMGALERLAIAISDAIGPAIAKAVPVISGFIDGLTKLVSTNRESVSGIAKLAVVSIAAGSALTGLGLSVRILSFSLGGVVQLISAATLPLRVVAKASMFAGGAFANVAGQLGGFATKGIGSVVLFASRTGMALAGASAGFGSLAVSAIESSAKIAYAFSGTALSGLIRFSQLGLAAIAQFSAKSTALLAVSAARSGATTASYFAGTISIVSATVARAVEGNMQAAAIGVKTFRLLGVAGATNALIAQQAMGRLAASGSGQLIRLGVQGSTALATIGGTALSVGAGTAGAFAKATATSGGALSRFAASGSGGFLKVAAAAVSAGAASVVSFAKAAVAGIAQAGALTMAWVGGLARITAASAISGVAMAASFLAPFAAIGAVVVAVGAVFYAFKDQIYAALSPIGDLVSQAANAMSTGFNTVVADASVVFSDLWATATSTFNGIRDAIANGDLAGAMDVLWAGLQAGWLRGVEALMSYVDPWIAFFQNTFTYLGTSIAQTWDALWTGVTATFNVFGAVLMGAFDNIINPILAMWDTLEAGVRKAWIRISGIFGDAEAKRAALEGVDAEMKGRADKRGKERPGIAGRVDKANAENAKEAKASEERRRAMGENADRIAQGRLDQNERNKEERRAATVAAEDRLAGLSQGKTAERQGRNTGNTLIDQLDTASSMDELRTISEQIHDLHSRGMITDEQKSAYDAKVDTATERVQESESGKPADSPVDAANRGAEDAAKSKVEVAGTFSANAALGMGFGTSLQERTAKAAEETAKNTAQIAAEGGGRYS